MSFPRAVHGPTHGPSRSGERLRGHSPISCRRACPNGWERPLRSSLLRRHSPKINYLIGGLGIRTNDAVMFPAEVRCDDPYGWERPLRQSALRRHSPKLINVLCIRTSNPVMSHAEVVCNETNDWERPPSLGMRRRHMLIGSAGANYSGSNAAFGSSYQTLREDGLSTNATTTEIRKCGKAKACLSGESSVAALLASVYDITVLLDLWPHIADEVTNLEANECRERRDLGSGRVLWSACQRFLWTRTSLGNVRGSRHNTAPRELLLPTRCGLFCPNGSGKNLITGVFTAKWQLAMAQAYPEATGDRSHAAGNHFYSHLAWLSRDTSGKCRRVETGCGMSNRRCQSAMVTATTAMVDYDGSYYVNNFDTPLSWVMSQSEGKGRALAINWHLKGVFINGSYVATTMASQRRPPQPPHLDPCSGTSSPQDQRYWCLGLSYMAMGVGLLWLLELKDKLLGEAPSSISQNVKQKGMVEVRCRGIETKPRAKRLGRNSTQRHVRYLMRKNQETVQKGKSATFGIYGAVEVGRVCIQSRTQTAEEATSYCSYWR